MLDQSLVHGPQSILCERHRLLWHFYRRKTRSYLHNLNSCKRKGWKEIQAWVGFESMTSVMPVQCTPSYQGFHFRNCLIVLITARVFLLFNLSPAVQIHVSHITMFIYSTSSGILRTHSMTSYMLAWKLSITLHRYRSGHGFKSCSSLNCFRLPLCNYLNNVNNYEGGSLAI